MSILKAILDAIIAVLRFIVEAILAILRAILWLLRKVFIDIIWDCIIDFLGAAPPQKTPPPRGGDFYGRKVYFFCRFLNSSFAFANCSMNAGLVCRVATTLLATSRPASTSLCQW